MLFCNQCGTELQPGYKLCPKCGTLYNAVSRPPKTEGICDLDGTALVVHAKADDYQTQPAGDAGDRVACAVIKLDAASVGGR